MLSRLNLLGTLFATIAGAGLLFAFFVTPQFRGLNRISPFIAFLSIFYFCIIFEKVFDKIKIEFNLKSYIRWISSFSLILFAYWDQLSPQHAPGIVHAYAIFDSNDSFFKNLERNLPPQSMIYQLPYVRYPESPMAFNEGYYALLRPYLHTDKIKWNYGQMGYRDNDAWMSALSTYPIEKQISILKEFNFSGILIDRMGFQDNGKELESKMSTIIKTAPIESPDKRYLFLSINDYKTRSSMKDTTALIPVYSSDWYPPEGDGTSKWAWSGSLKEYIIFQSFVKKTSRCVIKFNIQGSGPSKVTVKTTEQINL